MHVTVADEWFAMPLRPALRAHVEVHGPREHRVPLDGVEQLRMPPEGSTQRAHRWKERVRRNHQTALAFTQARQLREGANRFGGAAVIEEQHMTPFDGAFDARNQRDATCARVVGMRRDIELTIVQGDRQGAIAELGRAIDQLTRGVRNPVPGVVSGMGMKIDFQHLLSRIHKACLSSRSAMACMARRKQAVQLHTCGRNSRARLDRGELRV
jgi:hypothetical protein